MPTMMQIVERLRERGQAPASGPVSLRALSHQRGSTPRGCLRPLIDHVVREIAVRKRWAVILCRYKGEAPDTAREQPIEAFYRRAFTPGTGGMIEYWRDVSLGMVDVSDSQVFGWVELEIPRSKAGTGEGTTRGKTVDYAINAVRAAGADPTTGFHSQMAIIAHNWSIDGVPAGSPDWGNPNDPLLPYYKYWIDGSTDGRGKVTLTPPHDGNIMAHEMGHGFGMHHDVGDDLTTHYADPCCIMSQQNAFVAPGWNVNFGPALCLPHLVKRTWMFQRRLYTTDDSWMSAPEGISVPLAPLTDPGAHANLGAQLPFRDQAGQTWNYYLELVTPVRWNRGLPAASLFIRRTAAIQDIGETPIILGSIRVPEMADVPASFREPHGDVLFTVKRFGNDGRRVMVTARKA
jgi:hypothetical protein